MRLKILYDFIKLENTDAYPSIWAWGGMLIGTIASLAVYWYTSQAFSPVVSNFVTDQKLSYFLFVISGELVLMLPTLLLEAPAQVVKQATTTGTITSILQLPCAHSTPIVYLSIAKIPSELIRFFIHIILINILFGVLMPLSVVLKIFLLTTSVLPAFLGLGLIAAAIVVVLGRGERILSLGISAATVFSGIYFPVSVLPDSIKQIIQDGSPFYFLLQRARDIITTSVTSVFSIEELYKLLLINTILMLIGVGSLRLGFIISKLRGTNLVIRY